MSVASRGRRKYNLLLQIVALETGSTILTCTERQADLAGAKFFFTSCPKTWDFGKCYPGWRGSFSLLQCRAVAAPIGPLRFPLPCNSVATIPKLALDTVQAKPANYSIATQWQRHGCPPSAPHLPLETFSPFPALEHPLYLLPNSTMAGNSQHKTPCALLSRWHAMSLQFPTPTLQWEWWSVTLQHFSNILASAIPLNWQKECRIALRALRNLSTVFIY